LGVKKGKLQSEAVAKLQGELEKEGRAASSSVAMPQKAAAGGSAAKRSSTRRGLFLANILNL
jgi:ATP-dependent Clp protease ATP-binding subunit ClpC